MTFDWKDGNWRKGEGTCWFKVGEKIRVDLFPSPDGYVCNVRYDSRLVATEDYPLRGENALSLTKMRTERFFESIQKDFNGN